MVISHGSESLFADVVIAKDEEVNDFVDKVNEHIPVVSTL